MKEAYFEAQWPKENLFMSGYAHRIMNYRYHWHQTEYELNILLNGSQEFCHGSETNLLEADDVLLVNPGTGHASFAQQADTLALVLHFSTAALNSFVKKGFTYHFSDCLSTKETRYAPEYNRIRFYAGQIFYASLTGGPYARLMMKASMELLLATLCTLFHTQTVKTLQEEDLAYQETVRRLIKYIEQHYNEKITLEDLAQFSQYNRTYVSTLFKNTVGVNFYEYLTRVRFQKALIELANTNKNLTEIAINNGFSVLKSFNARFKEALHRSPADYRAQLSPDRIVVGEQLKFISWDEPLLRQKLSEYVRLPE